MRFVELDGEQFPDQSGIADLGLESEECRSDLRIECA
jgi:hypothetical protein